MIFLGVKTEQKKVLTSKGYMALSAILVNPPYFSEHVSFASVWWTGVLSFVGICLLSCLIITAFHCRNKRHLVRYKQLHDPSSDNMEF